MPLIVRSISRRLAVQELDETQPGRAQAIEALLSPAFVPPFADQETLRLEPLQQRIQRALLDDEPLTLQRLAQRVAVLLGPELSEHGQREAAAAQLLAKRLDAGCYVSGGRRGLQPGGRSCQSCESPWARSSYILCGTTYWVNNHAAPAAVERSGATG